MNSAPFVALAVTALTFAACSVTSSETVGRGATRVTVADCSAAAPWAPGVSYAVGALVSYDGANYQCIQAHTSEPGWTPDAVAALWEPVSCGGGGGTTSGGGSGGAGGGGGSSGSGPTCDPSAWVYMGNSASACDGRIGESCGWTTADEGQGYHCAATSWGTGCEPGGAT
ncbi:MAG TPA: carbohydrate-binding protein, partial [Polyangiaceae bacterium]